VPSTAVLEDQVQHVLQCACLGRKTTKRGDCEAGRQHQQQCPRWWSITSSLFHLTSPTGRFMAATRDGSWRHGSATAVPGVRSCRSSSCQRQARDQGHIVLAILHCTQDQSRRCRDVRGRADAARRMFAAAALATVENRPSPMTLAGVANLQRRPTKRQRPPTKPPPWPPNVLRHPSRTPLDDSLCSLAQLSIALSSCPCFADCICLLGAMPNPQMP
jgi:hypothetical protein